MVNTGQKTMLRGSRCPSVSFHVCSWWIGL